MRRFKTKNIFYFAILLIGTFLSIIYSSQAQSSFKNKKNSTYCDINTQSGFEQVYLDYELLEKIMDRAKIKEERAQDHIKYKKIPFKRIRQSGYFFDLNNKKKFANYLNDFCQAISKTWLQQLWDKLMLINHGYIVFGFNHQTQKISSILIYQEKNRLSSPIENYIELLCVDRNERSKGLGKKILQRFQRNLLKKNYPAFILSLSPIDPVINFYKKFGLQVHEDTVLKNGKEVDFLTMRKLFVRRYDSNNIPYYVSQFFQEREFNHPHQDQDDNTLPTLYKVPDWVYKRWQKFNY